jgi:hypothetical protein
MSSEFFRELAKKPSLLQYAYDPLPLTHRRLMACLPHTQSLTDNLSEGEVLT